MGDVQPRVDEALPPYVRLIRSRYQNLDQGHHMSARSMSEASKGVGGYDSSEVRHYARKFHLHPLRRRHFDVFDRTPATFQRRCIRLIPVA